jgi:hypothetical protein
MIARVFISNLRGSMAKVILPALLSSTLCIHCASDQKSGQQGDPIDESASQGSAESTALNENGGSKNSEASAQGASMNNAVDGDGGGAGEGNSGGNFSGGNNSGGNSFGNNSGAGNGGATVTNENAALGASLNNVKADDPLAGGNVPLNTTLDGTLNTTATEPVNAPLNQAAASGSNTLTPVTANSAPAVDAPQSAPAPSKSTTNANARAGASPFNNPHMNWPGKGKVKYVTRQVTRHASPNGPVVGEFEQGEHPLIFQNGNWVELNDGSFVKGNGLSDKGVGYAKGKQTWR